MINGRLLSAMDKECDEEELVSHTPLRILMCLVIVCVGYPYRMVYYEFFVAFVATRDANMSRTDIPSSLKNGRPFFSYRLFI